MGHWDASPVGPFVDLMWAAPGGERLLLVPDASVGAFVTAVYAFDRVAVVADLAASWDGERLEVAGGGRRVALRAGRGVALPPRPLWVTRWVEPVLSRPLTGARTYGTSPSGVREWYPASRVRPIRWASASIGGVDLGRLRPPLPAAGFGFSEPPRWPALTEVRPRLQDPSGRLDRLLTSLAT